MSVDWGTIAIVVALACAATSAGVFFAFSNFVMKALATLTPTNGVVAMQAINKQAPTRTFVATILLAAFVAIPVLISDASASRSALAIGIAASVVSMLITVGFNVPKNNALDQADACADETGIMWRRWVQLWTYGNTARGLASIVSAIAYALALRGR